MIGGGQEADHGIASESPSRVKLLSHRDARGLEKVSVEWVHVSTATHCRRMVARLSGT